MKDDYVPYWVPQDWVVEASEVVLCHWTNSNEGWLCTLLSAAGLGGGGLWGGTLPLNDPIDELPDCSASLLCLASTGEVPGFLADIELSANELQQALKQH